MGVVLSQVQKGAGKTLAPPEKGYCVTRKELPAVVKAVKNFCSYLHVYGQQFKLRTDHASLRWLCLRKKPSNQVIRWLEILAKLKYTLEHRAGLKHGNADGLSRGNCGNCRRCDLIEGKDGGPNRFKMNPETLNDALKVTQLNSSYFSQHLSALKVGEDKGKRCGVLPKNNENSVTRISNTCTPEAGELAHTHKPMESIL